jgi:DNA polymerase III delta prime subunit
MFGRPEIDLVKKIANFLETEEWQLPTKPLIDFLFIEPDEKGKISLDTAKKVSGFLWQKPIQSQRRLVVIDQAETLTPHAQNALLKIVEEPPAHALLILLAPDPEVLISPLQSRLQKIFCNKPSRKVNTNKAQTFLKSNSAKRSVTIKTVVSDDQLLKEFVRGVMAELDKDPIGNFMALKELTYRWNMISRYNTNKKLQLEAWTRYLTG